MFSDQSCENRTKTVHGTLRFQFLLSPIVWNMFEIFIINRYISKSYTKTKNIVLTDNIQIYRAKAAVLKFGSANSHFTTSRSQNWSPFYSFPVALGQICFVLVLISTNHNARYLYPEMDIARTGKFCLKLFLPDVTSGILKSLNSLQNLFAFCLRYWTFDAPCEAIFTLNIRKRRRRRISINRTILFSF